MINLLYSGNDKVFDGIMLSLLSITKYTKEELNVYVLTMNLEGYNPISKEQITFLKEMLKEKNKLNEITPIDLTDLFKEEMKDSLNLNNFYTPYCLLRLFADKVDIPEKIIYLDTDTMCHGDLSSLFNIDVENYEFAGVLDRLGRWFISSNYFNSGVLLLNIKEIKKTGLFEKARLLCKTKKMAFPDQTALHRLAKRKLVIPTKFNSQRWLKEDTVIQHFCKSIRFIPFYHTINVKPWDIENVHKRLKIFAYDDIFEEFKIRRSRIQ